MDVSWTVKTAEHQRIDAFELWCWRRLLRVPWTARRSNPFYLFLRSSSGQYFCINITKLFLPCFLHIIHLFTSFQSFAQPWAKPKNIRQISDFQSWLKRKITLRDIESGARNWYNNYEQNKTGRGLAAIYRQEIIEDVSFFISQSVVRFYDKLFSVLDFELPRHDTGRKGFPKEAMLCALFRILFLHSIPQIRSKLRELRAERLRELGVLLISISFILL